MVYIQSEDVEKGMHHLDEGISDSYAKEAKMNERKKEIERKFRIYSHYWLVDNVLN